MKKIFIMMFALLTMMSINAQTVESSRFFDNWSVELKGGAVTPLNHSAFWGDMRGLVGVELQKDITPIFGLGVEGEWTVNTSGWHRNVHSANVFDHQLVGGFMSVNLMNAIAGYRGTPRVCEVELVGGTGWLHAYQTGGVPDANSWYTKFGTNVNFNLGKTKAWTLSVKPAVVFDMLGSGTASFNSNHLYLELQAGVAYHFKTHNGTHSFKLCDKVATRAEMDELNAEINRLRGELAEANARPVTTVTTERVVEKTVLVERNLMNNVIGFNLNSSKILETQYANLYNVAQILKDNPDVNVSVVGYADKATGSASYNQTLSMERATNVRDALVNDFGVNPSQITVVANGSSTQPFAENDYNRAVLFVVDK